MMFDAIMWPGASPADVLERRRRRHQGRRLLLRSGGRRSRDVHAVAAAQPLGAFHEHRRGSGPSVGVPPRRALAFAREPGQHLLDHQLLHRLFFCQAPLLPQGVGGQLRRGHRCQLLGSGVPGKHPLPELRVASEREVAPQHPRMLLVLMGGRAKAPEQCGLHLGGDQPVRHGAGRRCCQRSRRRRACRAGDAHQALLDNLHDLAADGALLGRDLLAGRLRLPPPAAAQRRRRRAELRGQGALFLAAPPVQAVKRLAQGLSVLPQRGPAEGERAEAHEARKRPHAGLLSISGLASFERANALLQHRAEQRKALGDEGRPHDPGGARDTNEEQGGTPPAPEGQPRMRLLLQGGQKALQLHLVRHALEFG
mmetsp:Transcript_96341/g.277456  ORF Transcript_96341/g.277456 Transcript_96341/m.277456 type:complete len:368 (-) Transcript_96341:113-1216(-)